MAQLLSHPAIEGSRFVDVGSGVGRLLLAVAAMDDKWTSGDQQHRRRPPGPSLPLPWATVAIAETPTTTTATATATAAATTTAAATMITALQ